MKQIEIDKWRDLCLRAGGGNATDHQWRELLILEGGSGRRLADEVLRTVTPRTTLALLQALETSRAETEVLRNTLRSIAIQCDSAAEVKSTT